MIRKVVITGERISEEEESEDTDDTDSAEPDIVPIGDISYFHVLTMQPREKP